MARKSRKNIPEVVSSATVQTEVSRPFRAGLYARISMETEETLERGTIETQVELMKNFVADTEDISVAEVYKDSDYSGTNFDRPGFVQMMEDIKHGKINCVIVKDLSRLGRNYVETSNYIERVFPFFHVRFLAVTDDFDSFREGVDLTVPLKNIINEFYSKDLAKKSSSAKKALWKKGYQKCFCCCFYSLCQTFRGTCLIWRETDLLDLYRLLCLLRSDTSEFKSIHIVCTHFYILLLLSCYFLHIQNLQVSHIVVLSTSGSFSLISHPNLPVRSVH